MPCDHYCGFGLAGAKKGQEDQKAAHSLPALLAGQLSKPVRIPYDKGDRNFCGQLILSGIIHSEVTNGPIAI